MYERAQQSPVQTRLAGASIAVVVTAMVGYALTTGVVQRVIAEPEKIMEVVMLAPEVSEPLKTPDLATTADVELTQPDVFVPLPVFESEEPAIMATLSEPTPIIEPTLATPTMAPGTPDARPKLKSSDIPPYPAASIRAQEQGTTRLEVCVSSNGRVTSATVAQSSGHVRLDEAALKWIRNGRFSPGSVGGVAQSMCGHPVDYQWNLKNAR